MDEDPRPRLQELCPVLIEFVYQTSGSEYLELQVEGDGKYRLLIAIPQMMPNACTAMGNKRTTTKAPDST